MKCLFSLKMCKSRMAQVSSCSFGFIPAFLEMQLHLKFKLFQSEVSPEEKIWQEMFFNPSKYADQEGSQTYLTAEKQKTSAPPCLQRCCDIDALAVVRIPKSARLYYSGTTDGYRAPAFCRRHEVFIRTLILKGATVKTYMPPLRLTRKRPVQGLDSWFSRKLCHTAPNERPWAKLRYVLPLAGVSGERWAAGG